MYPNPQDVLRLPPHPDLEQYRKRAKDLVKACRSGDTHAINKWAARWIRDLISLLPSSEKPSARDVEQRNNQVAEFAREQLTESECALASAQLVLARAHGFSSWTRFTQHIAAITGNDSAESDFERAADAIVKGDVATLQRLLRHDPGLARARSNREHNATLLHYVSANGVENYRQITPGNILEITRILVDAGAEVDAEAEVYGGGATTFALVVTSAHPRAAGVQNDLADLLLERGARVPPGMVRDCLANGCPEAARHIASLGVNLDLEEAAGIGRLDLVQRYFDDGRVTTSDRDVVAALMMASWYGHRDVITYLLDLGLDAGVRAPGKQDGQTALHIASYQGDVQLVDLLLQRGAPVNVNDSVYGTPPIVWAMHAWLAEGRHNAEDYRNVLHKLLQAGAHIKPNWIDDDRLREDPRLYQILLQRAREHGN